MKYKEDDGITYLNEGFSPRDLKTHSLGLWNEAFESKAPKVSKLSINTTQLLLQLLDYCYNGTAVVVNFLAWTVFSKITIWWVLNSLNLYFLGDILI